MRSRFLLAGVALVLAGCAGSKSSNGHTLPTAAPTRPGAPAVVQPVPGMTPAKPGTFQKIPTQKPLPTPTVIPAAAYTDTIVGQVVDAKSRSPIAGATVLVGFHLRRTKTDAFGRYSIPFPAGPAVPVLAQARGYSQGLAMGALPPHKRVTVNFKLHSLHSSGPPVPPAPQSFGKP